MRSPSDIWSPSPIPLCYTLQYTEAKVDVTQEIEQRAQWSAPPWAACCALCSISCVTSTLASVYAKEHHTIDQSLRPRLTQASMGPNMKRQLL